MIGSETYTPDGYRQLTNQSIYFRLESKQTLDENGWAQDTEMTGGLAQAKTIFYPGVSMSDFPVVALSGDIGSFAQVTAASGGINIKVSRMTTSPAIPVTIYLFSKRPPPDPGMGYALYNSGQIVFSILTPVMRPVGSFDNDGYVGVSLEGRTCAHVSQLRSQSASTIFTSGGLGSCLLPPLNTPAHQIFVTDQWQAQMVKCNGSSVAIDTKSRRVGPISYVCTQNPQGYGANQVSAPNYKSLIIDVTNF